MATRMTVEEVAVMERAKWRNVEVRRWEVGTVRVMTSPGAAHVWEGVRAPLEMAPIPIW